MMMLSVRLSRTHSAQLASITMMAITLVRGRILQANQKPRVIIRTSLKELNTLSPT